MLTRGQKETLLTRLVIGPGLKIERNAFKKDQSMSGKWCILTVIKFILLKKSVSSEISYVSSNESRATLKNHRAFFGVEERDSPFRIFAFLASQK